MPLFPSLKIIVPIVYASQSNEKSFQEALLDGAAHYPGTAEPGQTGNCFIFGHSSDFFGAKVSIKLFLHYCQKLKLVKKYFYPIPKDNVFLMSLRKVLRPKQKMCICWIKTLTVKKF